MRIRPSKEPPGEVPWECTVDPIKAIAPDAPKWKPSSCSTQRNTQNDLTWSRIGNMEIVFMGNAQGPNNGRPLAQKVFGELRTAECRRGPGSECGSGNHGKGDGRGNRANWGGEIRPERVGQTHALPMDLANAKKQFDGSGTQSARPQGDGRRCRRGQLQIQGSPGRDRRTQGGDDPPR